MFPRNFKLLIVSIIALLVFVLLHLNRENSMLDSKSKLSDDEGCKIPKISPFDLQSSLIFRKKQELKCTKYPPSFIKVMPKNQLYIDRDLLKKFYGEELKECEYVPILRGNTKVTHIPDDGIRFNLEAKVVFSNHTSVSESFVKITCKNLKDKIFFSEYKAFIVEIPEKRVKNPLMPNILILGIDSVSRMNFQRHFKKTQKFLREIGSIDLRGYNKVELNTLVNMVPLFTGRHAKSFINLSDPTYFDDLPFIWKNFSEVGFVTLFAEDGPKMGMFNYGNKGFKRQPMDYYFRPFSVSVDLDRKYRGRSPKCIGTKLEAELVFDWIFDFCKRYSDGKYFAVGYTSTLTHDDINDAGHADYPLERLLRKLYTGSIMKDTILFLISDHGLQFADELVMDPYSWQLEERLPFAHIVLPEWFLISYPWAKEILKNSDKLTSPFDIFETLKDILNMFKELPAESTGKSLFRPIPSSRTCKNAGITEHFCACYTYEKVPQDDPKVERAAHEVVSFINIETAYHRGNCAYLIMDGVHSAKKRTNNGFHNKFDFYRLIIKTVPNKGLYESTVKYDVDEDSFSVVGDQVNRINRYGNQSSCITTRKLFPYCYCIDVSTLV